MLSAFLKYGYFKLEIEYYDKYKLAEREQYFIYHVKPLYNNLTFALLDLHINPSAGNRKQDKLKFY